MAVVGLACRECGKRYPVEPIFVCEDCFGPLEAQYDLGNLTGPALREQITRGPASIWRYEALLPASAFPNGISRPGSRRSSGGSPRPGARPQAAVPQERHAKPDVVVQGPRRRDGGRHVQAVRLRRPLVRVDRQPRERRCRPRGESGHARGRVHPEGHRTRQGDGTSIYRPTVVEVEGTYDDVNRLCLEIGEEHRWGIANVNLRPYYSEGAKTLGFEVAEQLGWRAPTG